MYLFIDLLIDGWTDESIDPSIHRSINQLIDWSIDWLIDVWTKLMSAGSVAGEEQWTSSPGGTTSPRWCCQSSTSGRRLSSGTTPVRTGQTGDREPGAEITAGSDGAPAWCSPAEIHEVNDIVSLAIWTRILYLDLYEWSMGSVPPPFRLLTTNAVYSLRAFTVNKLTERNI